MSIRGRGDVQPNRRSALERALVGVTDPLIRRYLEFFYGGDMQIRIRNVAAKLLREMGRRRYAGCADFEHELRDLIQNAWAVLLRQRREFPTAADFLDAYSNTMENYCRWRRRSTSGRSFLDDSPGVVDRQSAAGKIISFPAPDAALSARQELALLLATIRRDAPDLEPLFQAFVRDVQSAHEQAVELDVPVGQIYEMRRRLRRLAASLFNAER
jgi:hypothetical protein